MASAVAEQAVAGKAAWVENWMMEKCPQAAATAAQLAAGCCLALQPCGQCAVSGCAHLYLRWIVCIIPAHVYPCSGYWTQMGTRLLAKLVEESA